MKIQPIHIKLAFWGWIAILFIAALIPGLGFTHARIDGFVFRADHLIHALVFFGITAIFAHARSRNVHVLNRYGWMKLVALCMVLTIAIETLQGLTGRTFSYQDMAANMIGLSVGLFFFLAVERVRS
jgi:VanZ like family.